MKRLAVIINSLMVLLICVGDAFYITKGTLLIKSITSALFVLMGVVNLIFAIKLKTNKLKFSIIILIGLVFAMLGDILLEIEFIVGAALFALGHVFFFISYCFLVKFNYKDLIYGVCIFVPAMLFILLAPMFKQVEVLMKVVCVVYALIISLMVGKSIANFVKVRSVLHLIIMIGSVLFFFSDLMLLLNVFGGVGRIAGVLCLATYYPAEFVLAYSILHASLQTKNINNKDEV